MKIENYTSDELADMLDGGVSIPPPAIGVVIPAPTHSSWHGRFRRRGEDQSAVAREQRGWR